VSLPTRIRLAAGAGDASPPAIAGHVAAAVLARGGELHVVDPRGRPREDGDPDWPLWVCVDADGSQLAAPPWGRHPRVVFGPGARAGTREIAVVDPLDDPVNAWPIVTWAGFGPMPPAVRALAGWGSRARPLPQLLREIAYQVEMHGTGHVVFDDPDLAQYGPDWMAALVAGIGRLPWRLTWEGRDAGRTVHGSSRRNPQI
jgi:hypothetical protein